MSIIKIPESKIRIYSVLKFLELSKGRDNNEKNFVRRTAFFISAIFNALAAYLSFSKFFEGDNLNFTWLIIAILFIISTVVRIKKLIYLLKDQTFKKV